MPPKFTKSFRPEADTEKALTTPLQTKLQHALALHKQGVLKQALLIYEEVLKTHPNHVDALHYSGIIAAQTKQYQKAITLIKRAIAIKPDHTEAYSNLGFVFQALHKFDAAVESYDRAIDLQPDYAKAYHNRGIALQALTQLDAAIESYDRAIALEPDFAEAYNNRGNALKELKQLDAALESYNRAIEIKPDYAIAYNNRGFALQELTQLDAALVNYDRAIAIQADFAEAYWNKSLALLLAGNFNYGWELYEWRWKTGSFTSPIKNVSQPLWLGKESLNGKTILLHSEQGLGDTIQFCRYTRLVADLGAKVIIEVEEPLANLLNNAAGLSELIVKGCALPEFDCHCPLLSLPFAFKTELHTIPFAQQYLKCDAGKLEHWKKRLGEKRSPRLGLVWSGGATHKNDSNRSIHLTALIAQLPAEFEYVSLQKEVRDIDESTLDANANIRHFGNELIDFTDTAALCELMDVVISVDTAVAHLSAALGKPTWVMLPFSPDWRWLLDRDGSPWYASIRLFRQQRIGDWDDVFERLKSALIVAYGQ